MPADGMTIPPFVPEIARGRLHGRGSCDVKGSMAAMLSAFARLVRERPPGSASVLLACTVDEEFTHTGSSRLAESNHGAELAIVAEPTSLNLVHCSQGSPEVEDPDEGRRLPQLDASPGRTPSTGWAASSKFSRDTPPRFPGSAPDPILGPPSLSVGRIEGGQSVNVVPDWCEIEVDRRLIPGEDAATCLAEACAVLDR